MSKERYVVVYDIPSDKRRKKISALLDGYGIRANYSVYEITATKIELKTMIKELKKLSKPKLDSIRLYRVCQNCKSASLALCDEAPPFDFLDFCII